MFSMFGRTEAPQKQARERRTPARHFLACEGIFLACCDIYLVLHDNPVNIIKLLNSESRMMNIFYFW